jgi:hypothetical protein
MPTIVRHAPSAARYLLGSIFLVFGLNGFLNFLPHPAQPPAALAFLGALVASGWLLPLVKGIEVAAAVMLLANRFVPLALTLLAPIILSIVGFHLVLAPAGAAIAILVLALELSLAWGYRRAYAPMLQARVAPQLPAGGLNPQSYGTRAAA